MNFWHVMFNASLIVIAVIAVFSITLLFWDMLDGFSFLISILKINERKFKAFLKSPYRLYKFFKPVGELYERSFANPILEAICCLDEYASNKKCFLSYEDFTNYVTNIMKCINTYVLASNVDETTKAEAVSESYKRLLRELSTAHFLKAGFKDHNEDVVIFLDSLKPPTDSPITKKDYKIFYSKDSEWVDFLRKTRTDAEAIAVYWILKIEENLCGKDSRLLITKTDVHERIIKETGKEFEYDL